MPAHHALVLLLHPSNLVFSGNFTWSSLLVAAHKEPGEVYNVANVSIARDTSPSISGYSHSFISVSAKYQMDIIREMDILIPPLHSLWLVRQNAATNLF
jgi:hypothetical protein